VQILNRIKSTVALARRVLRGWERLHTDVSHLWVDVKLLREEVHKHRAALDLLLSADGCGGNMRYERDAKGQMVLRTDNAYGALDGGKTFAQRWAELQNGNG
jgi:hypothetical protein